MNDAVFLATVAGGLLWTGVGNIRASIVYCTFEGHVVVIGLKAS